MSLAALHYVKMRVSPKVGAVTLLLGIVAAIFLLNRSTPTTVITGHVYTRFAKNSGPLMPVGNAVISNDWDSTTSTTDSSGSFRLALTKRIAADEFVVLTARSDDTAVRQPMIGRAHMDGVEIQVPSAK